MFEGILLRVEGGLSGGFSVKRCSPPGGKYAGSVAGAAEVHLLIKAFLCSPIDEWGWFTECFPN